MTKKAKSERLWTIPFILVFVVTCASSLAMNMLNNSISLYVQDVLGKDMTFSGVLALLFAIAAIVTRFFSGDLADKRGRRLLMVLGMLAFSLSTIAMGLIPSVFAACLFRFLQGVGFSFANTASMAAGSDIMPESRVGEGIGYLGLSSAISSAIATAIVLFFINSYGYLALFILIAGIILVGVLSGSFVRYEKDPGYLVRRQARLRQMEEARRLAGESANEKGIRRFIEKRALPASLIQFLASFVLASMLTYLTVYGKSRGLENVSLFFTLAAVTMFLSRMTTGRITDKHNPLVVLLPAYASMMVACYLLATTYNSTVFHLCGILYGAGMGCMQPIYNSIAVKRSPPNRFGAANATFMLAVDAGVGLGGYFWGMVIDNFGYTVTYFSALVLYAVTAVITIFLFRKGVVTYSEEMAQKGAQSRNEAMK